VGIGNSALRSEDAGFLLSLLRRIGTDAAPVSWWLW